MKEKFEIFTRIKTFLEETPKLVLFKLKSWDLYSIDSSQIVNKAHCTYTI